jgi:alpha-galactosidase
MPDATTLAQGIVSEDKAQGLFMVSQLAMPDYSLMMPLRMAGLEASARYRITLLDHPNIQNYGRGRAHHAQAAGVDGNTANGER